MNFSLTTDLRRMARDIRALGRQHERALLVALDRTAVDVQAAERAEMQDSFDRPTPYTLRGVFVQRTRNRVPEAAVGLPSQRQSGARGAGVYLEPQIEGGRRELKGFERRIRQLGVMDGTQFIVPGRFARLDAYGNVSRGQILQVLSQLRAFGGAETVSRNLVRRDGTRDNQDRSTTREDAARRRTAAFRRAGGQYFAVGPAPRGGLQPGIYQRQVLGARTAGPADRRPRAVFLFVDRVSYEQRFDFYAAAEYAAERSFPRRLDEALAQAVAGGSA